MNPEKLTLLSLYKRLTGPTPCFWIAVRNLMLKATGIAGALLLLIQTGQLAVSDQVQHILLIVVKVAPIIAGTAQATTPDQPQNIQTDDNRN